MNKWDNRFLDLAKLVSTWSKDPSTGVGAVITDPSNRIISTGFNGFPRGFPDEYKDRDHKLAYTIHAEENAILFANTSLKGMTLYCTHPCCTKCSSIILQVGISKVITTIPNTEFDNRWGTEGITMLRNNGIKVEML